MDSQNYTPIVVKYKSPVSMRKLIFFGISLFTLLTIWDFYLNSTLSNNNLSCVETVGATSPTLLDRAQVIGIAQTKNKPNANSKEISGTIMKFSSKDLGLSFNYLTHQRDLNSSSVKPKDVFTSRVKNKICLTYDLYVRDETGCQLGDSVEVYKKDSKLSLKDAVQANFLQGTQKLNCSVKTSRLYSFEIAEITPVFSESCPEKYTKLENRNRYFLYDKDFPDRMAFFNFGPAPILADADYTPWQETFSFIK